MQRAYLNLLAFGAGFHRPMDGPTQRGRSDGRHDDREYGERRQTGFLGGWSLRCVSEPKAILAPAEIVSMHYGGGGVLASDEACNCGGASKGGARAVPQTRWRHDAKVSDEVEA